MEELVRAVSKLLNCPDNLGIELRPVRLPGRPKPELLLLFVQGIADDNLVRSLVLDPLQHLSGPSPPPDLGELQHALPAPRLNLTDQLSAAIRAALEGSTALFAQGDHRALLIDTANPATRSASPNVTAEPTKDLFDRDLMTNIALIRQRLRDPALIARPISLPGGRPGRGAILALQGQADPNVVAEVRRYLEEKGSEQALRRGLAGRRWTRWMLLPDLLANRWPDKAAALLEAGYVVALIDGVAQAYLAPVTAPAILYGPLDQTMNRPIAGLLRSARAFTALLVLVAAASVVALLNYHQEMMPSQFVLGLAAGREQSPFPIVVEVVLLELLQELVREVGFHLPIRLAPGSALIVGKLLILIMAQAGIVGYFPAVISISIALITMGLLNYEVIWLTRIWRFLILAGAGIFGFFGMTVVLFVLMAYLTRAESFGVPFLGETGINFRAPGRISSHRQGGV